MTCRSCGGDAARVFSLGAMPLANSLLESPDEPFARYPLDLALCSRCTLVQLEETVPPEALFVDYSYLTSCSPPMVDHARVLVGEVLRRRSFTDDSFVVEIGSNDGYLLQHYVAHGISVLGIDPSERAAEVAMRHRVPTLTRFFGAETAAKVGQRADVIHANNVLAHVPDLNDFVAGLAALLAPDGMLIVEVPYLPRLIDKTAFDTIYHEHVYYFSLTALDLLFRRHGLIIADADEIETHGGSLRLWIDKHGPAKASVHHLLSQESVSIGAPGYYADFAARVDACKRDTLAMLSGRRVAGFGAAAKATIFLNACGITSAEMTSIADDTPSKQGRYIPGTGIRVVPVREWLADAPDATMILAWNFAHEIAHRYTPAYRGQFFTWYTGLGVSA